MELLLDNTAIFEIKSQAASLYATKTMPIYLGNEVVQVQQDDLAKLCLIEATIMYLNQHNALNVLPKFDYTHDRFKTGTKP